MEMSIDNRRGYWRNGGAYRSKDNKMFDRLIRNSIGSVMKDKFMTSQNIGSIVQMIMMLWLQLVTKI